MIRRFGRIVNFHEIQEKDVALVDAGWIFNEKFPQLINLCALKSQLTSADFCEKFKEGKVSAQVVTMFVPMQKLLFRFIFLMVHNS